MSLTKVNYIDNSTIITAQNLNDIQDNIIQNAELIKKVTPRNLLDNSDFRNPVNQRGQKVYSFDNGYAIDRWRLHWTGDGSLTLNDGYISLSRPIHTAYLFQNLPLELGLIGKTVTVAAKVRGSSYVGFCFNDGSTREGASISDSGWTILTKTIQVPAYSYDNCILNGVELANIPDKNFDIKWVALYEGEYTSETLPEYQPKGYDYELSVCRCYYRHAEWLNCVKTVNTLFSISQSISMRVQPTITAVQFSVYGRLDVTDLGNYFIECNSSVVGVQCITYADLPTCSEFNGGGLMVHMSADL